MKNKIPMLLRALIGSVPLWLNNIISLRYFVYLDRKLIAELGFDGYLDDSGITHYKFGTGSAAQIGIFLIMIVSVIWILITSRFLFQEKKKKIIYKVVSIGLVLAMYIFWVWYYLDYYPLTGNLEIWY